MKSSFASLRHTIIKSALIRLKDNPDILRKLDELIDHETHLGRFDAKAFAAIIRFLQNPNERRALAAFYGLTVRQYADWEDSVAQGGRCQGASRLVTTKMSKRCKNMGLLDGGGYDPEWPILCDAHTWQENFLHMLPWVKGVI